MRSSLPLHTAEEHPGQHVREKGVVSVTSFFQPKKKPKLQHPAPAKSNESTQDENSIISSVIKSLQNIIFEIVFPHDLWCGVNPIIFIMFSL